MESHSCKLCFRIFPDGRSLDGHMRSHFLPLAIPAWDGHPVSWVKEQWQQLASSVTSEEKAQRDRGAEEEGNVRFQKYGLRENPEKSICAAGHEFRVEEHNEGSGSYLLQDRESETESSKNLTRIWSKRVRRGFPLQREKLGLQSDKLFEVKVGNSSDTVSSISDETSDDDVAFCLMLLSRDRWKYETEIVENRRDEKRYGNEDKEEDKIKKHYYYMSESKDRTAVKSKNGKKVKMVQGKHRCKTCNKRFRSYQALGGHRASHKKMRLGVQTVREVKLDEYDKLESCDNKVYGCLLKRSHAGNSNYFVATTTWTETMARSCSVPEQGVIDLHLPATMDD